MSDSQPPEDDIAPLLRIGLDDDVDPDATILVSAPTPRTGSSTDGGARGWQPPTLEELQHMLPQYEISAFIARGGMGAVYKGAQKTLKRPVAIKVLPPDLEDGDLQFAARFKHEAQAMAQLSHPNIVAVFDAGEAPGGLLYFVMEYIEGTDVAQLIASEGIIEPQRAIQITTAVCEALAFAHEEGIIHRDIKPSNIMLDKRGRVKVADFGLAKTVNVETALLTGTNMAMGTPDFIAPEALISGVKVDQRADIYAVGVMLYQMLTGHIPRGRFELPSGVVQQVDKGFDPIVDKAMQTDREKRYSTALEMKQDVERVGSSGFSPPGSVPPDGLKPELRTKSRKPLLLATAAVILLGTAAWFLMDESTEAEGRPSGPTSVSQSPSLPVSPSSTSAPDRAAALRVLERGGTVMIRTSAGVMQNVTDSAALPAGTFTLEQAEVRTKSGSKSGFMDTDMALFTGLPELRRILLVETQITGAALAVLKTLPALKFVELDRNKALRDDDLKHLGGCPLLDGVSLHHPEMFTAGVVEHLSALKQLTKLEIGDVTLSSAEVKLLLRLTKLQTLRVSRTSLRATDLEQLQALPDLQTITVSLAQLERPMSFGSFPSLTKIVIDDALTSDAVKSLGTATKLEALNLDLPGRMEAAIFTEIVRTLKNLKNLTLNLDQPLPPGEPLAALAALPKLERVALGQFSGINQFDDAALLSLAKVPTLKVFLLGTKTHRVTAQGIAAFQKLRPDVKIEGTGLAAVPSGPLSAQSKTDAPPTAAASSPNLPVSKSSPYPPGPWIDVTDEVRSDGIKDGTLKVNGQDLEATRKKGFILQGGRQYTDVAVRVRYAGWLALKLRQNTSAEAYGIMVQPADTPPHLPWVRLNRQMHRQGHGLELEAVDLNRWLNAGLGPPEAMHDFIFAVQGTRLSVWLDGSLLGTITDDKITSPGRIELSVMPMDTKGFTTLRKVEVINLDGLSEADALKAAVVDAQPSTAYTSPASKSSVFPAGQWVPLIRSLDDVPEYERSMFALSADGRWIIPQAPQDFRMRELHGRNWGLKAVFRREGLRRSHLLLRVQGPPDTREEYRLGLVNPQGVSQVAYFRNQGFADSKTSRSLSSKNAPAPMAEGDEYTLEFYTIGSKLIGRLNGKLLHQLEDSGLQEGTIGLNAGEAFRNVEVINLDGLSEAEALKAAGLPSIAPSVPAWVNALDGKAGILSGEAKIGPEGLHLAGRELVKISPLTGPKRQGAVRLRAAHRPGILGPQALARSEVQKYLLVVDGNGSLVRLVLWDEVAKQGPLLRGFTLPQPLGDGEEYELELAAIGSTLTAKLNGKLLGTVDDPTLTEGSFGVGNAGADTVLVKALHFLNLDGLSEAEALKAAGTAPISSSSQVHSKPLSTLAKAGLWVNATEEVKQNGLERNLLSMEGDWLIAKRGINYFPVSGTLELADAAVRVVFRGRVQVKLRQQPASEKFAGYIASVGNGKGGGIGFTGPTTDKEWLKPDLDLGQAYQPDEEHELVFAVHSNQLIFVMDGSIIARVQDGRFQKGRIELATLMDQADDPNPTRIKKVEYMSLDGLSEAEARKAAGVAATPKPTPAWESHVFATMNLKPRPNAEMQGPYLHLSGADSWFAPTHPSCRDVAIRTTLVWDAKLRNVKLVTRDAPSPHYLAMLHPDSVMIGIYEGNKDRAIKSFRITPTWKEGDEVVFQFASIGSQLAVWLNGKLLGTVVDTTLTGSGEAHLQASEGRFKNVDILNLDGLSEAEALKAAGVEKR